MVKKITQENEELEDFMLSVISVPEWDTIKKSCSLGMVSNNREDKIQFIKDDLNKKSLDDIILSLETYPSGYVQGAILQLWPSF